MSSNTKQIETIDKALYWLCGTGGDYTVGWFGGDIGHGLLGRTHGGCYGSINTVFESMMELGYLAKSDNWGGIRVTSKAYQAIWGRQERKDIRQRVLDALAQSAGDENKFRRLFDKIIPEKEES